jgi:integrase/recombinase XerD
MLETFYSTGIRRAELARLELSDLNLEKQVMRVRGKGRKERMVPVGTRALHWLGRYLDEVRPLLTQKPDEQALFLTGYGDAFNPEVLGRKVSRYIQQADIGRTGGPHLLRHTCATHMHDNGAGIRHVQQLLGHAKLETTAIYTHVSILELKAVHARCHPAEKKKTE